MRQLITFAVGTALLVALSGCGDKSGAAGGGGAAGGAADIVGKYKAEVKAPPGKENDPGVKMGIAMAQSMSLEFKADKTFLMNMLLNFEGTYAVSGDTVTLTVTKMGGQAPSASDKSKPMILKISDGGKTLTPVKDGAPSPDDPDMKFVKT